MLDQGKSRRVMQRGIEIAEDGSNKEIDTLRRATSILRKIVH